MIVFIPFLNKKSLYYYLSLFALFLTLSCGSLTLKRANDDSDPFACALQYLSLWDHSSLSDLPTLTLLHVQQNKALNY